MAQDYSPSLVTKNLVFCGDAAMKSAAGPATLLYDKVNNNNGTMYNGSCADFDGTDDYIDCGTPSSMDSLSAFTISFWFQLDSLATDHNLISKGLYSSAYSFFIQARPSQAPGVNKSYHARLTTNGSTSTVINSAQTTWTTSDWYHLVLVYTGSEAGYYINGDQLGAFTAFSGTVGPGATSETLKIGRLEGNESKDTNGKIADVRIYNVALSAANAKELYDDSKVIIPTKNDASGGFVTQTNLIGWWPMVDGVGNYAYDGSGNGHTGTLQDNAQWTTGQTGAPQLVEGYNRPMWFDDTDDYVAIGTTNPMQFIWSDNFSLSAWIYCDTVSGFKHIIGKTYGNYRFAQDGGTISFRLDTNVVLCAATCLTAKKWHHVVATYQTNSPSAGGTAKVYCDGSLLSTCASSSLDWTSTGGTFQIGNSPGESYYFGGIINECIAYNKTLSLAEVQALANTDANGGPLPPNPMSLADSGNVVGYWRNDGDVTWTDRSSNSNYGTVAGSPSALLFKQGYNGSASTTTGRDNQGFPLRVKNVGAIGFNGSSDYVSLTSRNYNLSTACSFLFWSKRLSSATNDYVLGNTGHSSYDKINFEGARLYLESNTNTDSAYTDAVCATDNEWHHYAVIVDAGTVSVYEDGVSLGMGAATVTDTYMTINEMGRAGTNVWFFGSIATMNTYDRALTYAEIQQNYKSFKARFGK